MIVLILTFLFILFWIRGNKVWACSCLLIVLSNCFNLKGTTDRFFEVHQIVFIIGGYFFIKSIRKKGLREILKKDKIFALFIISSIVFFVDCILTVTFSIDTFRYAFAVYRIFIGPLWLYYLVENLTNVEIKKILHVGAWIFGILVVFNILFSLGISCFDETKAPEGSERIGIALESMFYVAYSLCIFTNKKKTLWYILPFVLGSFRGPLVAFFAAFFCNVRRNIIKTKYLIWVAIICLTFSSVISTFVDDTMNHQDISFTEEIKMGINITNGDYSNVRETGTLAFRTALLMERWKYILSNPEYLPFGVGMIDENSPNNRFNFFMGTAQDNLKFGKSQIESVDLLWATPLLRYGIMGIIFYCLFFILFIKRFKCINNPYANIGALYIMLLLFTSMTGDHARRPEFLFPLFMVAVYVQRIKNMPDSLNKCRYKNIV